MKTYIVQELEAEYQEVVSLDREVQYEKLESLDRHGGKDGKKGKKGKKGKGDICFILS